MAIPGIKVSQSALDSYKASREVCDLPKKFVESADVLKSVASARKPVGDLETVNLNKEAVSYAVSHGNPDEIGKNLDVNA